MQIASSLLEFAASTCQKLSTVNAPLKLRFTNSDKFSYLRNNLQEIQIQITACSTTRSVGCCDTAVLDFLQL